MSSFLQNIFDIINTLFIIHLTLKKRGKHQNKIGEKLC